MDDSLYANLPGSQGSSQEDPHKGSTATRFNTSAQLNARNLFDETMDLDAAGTADIPDEDSRMQAGPSGFSSSYRYGRTEQGYLNGTDAARLPSSEFGRLQLHDQARTETATAAASSRAPLEQTVGDVPPQDESNGEDDLPTVPPLSAEERRQQALTRERDDLAKMNTLLEQAIASINRTVPKMEVCIFALMRNRCLGLRTFFSLFGGIQTLTYLNVLSASKVQRTRHMHYLIRIRRS